MKRPLLVTLLLLPLMLAACTGPDATADDNEDLKPGPGGPDPEHLTSIRYFNSSLGVGDYTVNITSAGQISVLEHVNGNTRLSTSQLTPDQINNLQNLFKGWKKLPSLHHGDWASMAQITYDNYQVEIHDLHRIPPQFADAMATLDKYAERAIAQSQHPASAPAN